MTVLELLSNFCNRLEYRIYEGGKEDTEDFINGYAAALKDLEHIQSTNLNEAPFSEAFARIKDEVSLDNGDEDPIGLKGEQKEFVKRRLFEVIMIGPMFELNDRLNEVLDEIL